MAEKDMASNLGMNAVSAAALHHRDKASESTVGSRVRSPVPVRRGGAFFVLCEAAAWRSIARTHAWPSMCKNQGPGQWQHWRHEAGFQPTRAALDTSRFLASRVSRFDPVATAHSRLAPGPLRKAQNHDGPVGCNFPVEAGMLP